MFSLVELSDTIRIEPWLFNVNQMDAIKLELNRRFCNKVVCDVGLCICLFDVLKLDDSYIFPGDGASHTKVTFRFIVFRPFIDEILVGKIKGCSSDGVTVTLGFFDDILITPDSLQHPSKFDEAEQVWVWEYETEDGTHDLFMDINEPIRFRVSEEIFTDTTPSHSNNEGQISETNNKSMTPYSIKGVISEPGLGLLSWWANS